MASFKDVVLSSGEEVRVYAPPSIKIDQMLRKKYPDPQMPFVDEVIKTTKRKIRVMIEDDPEYLLEIKRVAELRREDADELNTLFALKDVEVPEGFDIETEMGDILRFSDSEWQPRKGTVGCKLDYIEWALLANSADVLLFQTTVAELIGIDLEAVESIEASFRGSVEEEAA